jgi:hypothetical protein
VSLSLPLGVCHQNGELGWSIDRAREICSSTPIIFNNRNSLGGGKEKRVPDVERKRIATLLHLARDFPGFQTLPPPNFPPSFPAILALYELQ